MKHGDFSDAALVLIGHGSTVHATSSAPTYQHAQELRRRGIFARVIECFWKEQPGIASVMRELTEPRVFVVPLFISEGYFTREAIPRELGLMAGGEEEFPRVRINGNQALFYCDPVGTHERMTELLLSRARAVVEQNPFPRAPRAKATTLFIAGHGTPRNEHSRKAIERQADLIRARGIYAAVHAVFMEEEPRIADWHTLAETRCVVLVPCFISEGMHVQEDIPVLLGEPAAVVRERLRLGQPTWRNPAEKHGRLLWYAASPGTDPAFADMILERVRERAG